MVVFDLDSLKTRSEVRVCGKNPDAVLYEEGSGKLYTFNGKSADVYVNIEDKNQIAVIDIATDKMVAQWPLAGCDEPTGLALDAAHKRLFSVCGNGVLAVTDADSGKAVARAAIGKGARTMAMDHANGRLYLPTLVEQRFTVLVTTP